MLAFYTRNENTRSKLESTRNSRFYVENCGTGTIFKKKFCMRICMELKLALFISGI
jgi:hypothetical protein